MAAAFGMRAGAFIRRARAKKGLSETDLACACRVREGTVRRWETGRQDIGLANAFVVCAALGITVPELIAAGKGR